MVNPAFCTTAPLGISPDHKGNFTGPQREFHRTTKRISPDHKGNFTGPQREFHRTTKRISSDHKENFIGPQREFHFIGPQRSYPSIVIDSVAIGCILLTHLLILHKDEDGKIPIRVQVNGKKGGGFHTYHFLELIMCHIVTL